MQSNHYSSSALLARLPRSSVPPQRPLPCLMAQFMPVVPSTPSCWLPITSTCTQSFSDVRISSLITSLLFICQPSWSRPVSCRCHFRDPRSYSALVPSCPYYRRSPTKTKRGFSRCPGITPTVNNPFTTYLCLFNRYLTYSQPGLPLYTPRGFTHSARTFLPWFVISRAHKRSPPYLGSYIWVSLRQ